jgi:aspartyl/asparaginyl beta-hydroxylase (cupin superfamily)
MKTEIQIGNLIDPPSHGTVNFFLGAMSFRQGKTFLCGQKQRFRSVQLFGWLAPLLFSRPAVYSDPRHPKSQSMHTLQASQQTSSSR